MVFETSASLHDAIKTADATIRQAVHDGDIVAVLGRLRGGILSEIFRSNHATLFPGGFPEQYFMFECCREWLMASKSGSLDRFLEGQREALQAFDIKYGRNGTEELAPAGNEAGPAESAVARPAPVTYERANKDQAGASGSAETSGQSAAVTTTRGESGGEREEPRPKRSAPQTRHDRPVVPMPVPLSPGQPMDVDGEGPRKRKRAMEEHDGNTEEEDNEEEEDDDDDDDDKPIVKMKKEVAKKGHAEKKQRVARPAPVPVNKYHIPRCERCERLNKTCQGQKNAVACYICARYKVGCRGRKGPLYDVPKSAAGRSARDAIPIPDVTSGEEDSAPGSASESADQPPPTKRSAARPLAGKTRPDAKGKKPASDADHDQWEAERKWEARLSKMERAMERQEDFGARLMNMERRVRKIESALIWTEERVDGIQRDGNMVREQGESAFDDLTRLDNRQRECEERLTEIEAYLQSQAPTSPPRQSAWQQDPPASPSDRGSGMSIGADAVTEPPPRSASMPPVPTLILIPATSQSSAPIRRDSLPPSSPPLPSVPNSPPRLSPQTHDSNPDVVQQSASGHDTAPADLPVQSASGPSSGNDQPMPPSPPWRMSVPPVQRSSSAPAPPPSNMHLEVINMQRPRASSVRGRGRLNARSPSPGPLRRSPRLASPGPSVAVPPDSAMVVDKE